MTTELPERIAVISDIHGNLHALEAVMDAIDEMGIRTVYCLGDVVGYGAFPNECVELLRFRRIPTLAGNHDHAALEMTDIQFFNNIAKAAVMWTRERLSEENADWLRQRPYTIVVDEKIFLVHASPDQPEQWGYVLTYGEARHCFECFNEKLCLIGHSHQPAVVELDDDQLSSPIGAEIEMRDDCRYLINVGSIGQPRDRNPHACFVSVATDLSFVHYHRVPYDVEAAQEAILSGGLPKELAIRIGEGW